MFNLFHFKSKIEFSVEEYIAWKTRASQYTAERHKEVLGKFIKTYKYKTIEDIKLDDITSFYKHCVENNNGVYSTITTMEAIRGFLSYYWSRKLHNINPRIVSNHGVIDLLNVEKNNSMEPMKQEKRGRPLKLPLIKQVKRLRDNEHLSFRAIAKAMGKDVSQVYVWYKVDLSKKSLSNA
jgi:site-specific recombinase XerD